MRFAKRVHPNWHRIFWRNWLPVEVVTLKRKVFWQVATRTCASTPPVRRASSDMRIWPLPVMRTHTTRSFKKVPASWRIWRSSTIRASTLRSCITYFTMRKRRKNTPRPLVRSVGKSERKAQGPIGFRLRRRKLP